MDIAEAMFKMQEQIYNLKAENEIRDNLSEKFRKEALSWANIANEYQKDKTKLEKTLQEIKNIAEKLMADNLCNNCDGIGLDANCQDTGCPYYQMDAILQKITKAEEE